VKHDGFGILARKRGRARAGLDSARDGLHESLLKDRMAVRTLAVAEALIVGEANTPSSNQLLALLGALSRHEDSRCSVARIRING
jgi:hypothetical protein